MVSPPPRISGMERQAEIPVLHQRTTIPASDRISFHRNCFVYPGDSGNRHKQPSTYPVGQVVDSAVSDVLVITMAGVK